jgi:hypothetical protein
MSELTNQKFKEISKSLHASIKENSSPTHTQMLQFLSQAMYSKPYEEVKSTILAGKKTVNVYSCQNMFYLFNKEYFVKAIPRCSFNELVNQVKISKIKADEVLIIEIPVFNDAEMFDSSEDYKSIKKADIITIVPTIHYIKKMAKLMGGFNEISIFNEFVKCHHFTISVYYENGDHIVSDVNSNEQMCEDWMYNVESEGVDGLCIIIEEGDEVDEYLNFGELLAATLKNGEWDIPSGQGGVLIRFFEKTC